MRAAFPSGFVPDEPSIEDEARFLAAIPLETPENPRAPRSEMFDITYSPDGVVEYVAPIANIPTDVNDPTTGYQRFGSAIATGTTEAIVFPVMRHNMRFVMRQPYGKPFGYVGSTSVIQWQAFMTHHLLDISKHILLERLRRSYPRMLRHMVQLVDYRVFRADFSLPAGTLSPETMNTVMVFEYLDRGDLDQFITDESSGFQSMSEYQKKSFVTSVIAQVFAQIHHFNLMLKTWRHRDLHVANVMLKTAASLDMDQLSDHHNIPSGDGLRGPRGFLLPFQLDFAARPGDPAPTTLLEIPASWSVGCVAKIIDVGWLKIEYNNQLESFDAPERVYVSTGEESVDELIAYKDPAAKILDSQFTEEGTMELHSEFKADALETETYVVPGPYNDMYRLVDTILMALTTDDDKMSPRYPDTTELVASMWDLKEFIRTDATPLLVAHNPAITHSVRFAVANIVTHHPFFDDVRSRYNSPSVLFSPPTSPEASAEFITLPGLAKAEIKVDLINSRIGLESTE